MKGRVICELLNVRKTPEFGENVAAVIKKGTELTVEPAAYGWLQAENDDVSGYVMAEFVEVESEANAGEIDENGNFIVGDKAIGHVDGDRITITDPEVIKETMKDMEPEEPEVPKKGGKKAVKADGPAGETE